MRGRNVVVIYCYDALAISEIRTRTRSVSKMNIDIGSASIGAIRLHARSFAYASGGFINKGSRNSLPWLFVWLPVFSLHSWSWSK